MLQNPTYIGLNHFKPEGWDDSQRITTEGDHTAIISADEFQQVQNMMNRKKKGQMSRNSYDYPYGGIVRCAKCGATYVGNSSKHKLANGEYKIYKNYRCRNAYTNNTCDAPGISEEQLNELVIGYLSLIEDRIQDSVNRPNLMDKTKLQKEVDISTKRRKNWMLALGDGTLTPAEYSDLVADEESRIAGLNQMFQEEMLYQNEVTSEDIAEVLRNMKDKWKFIDAELQKEMIQAMFRKIVINKSDDWIIEDVLTV